MRARRPGSMGPSPAAPSGRRRLAGSDFAAGTRQQSVNRWTRPARAGKVGRMSIRIQCLCVDTTDPARLAAFWAEALGWRQTHAEDDEVVLEPPAGSPEDGVAPDLLFLRVPEGK